jgi:hypothetical protein
LSGCDQASRHNRGGCLERLEPKLLLGYAELDQLSLIDPDGVIVGLGGMVDGVLQGADRVVLLLELLVDLSPDLLDVAGVDRPDLRYPGHVDLLLLEFLGEALETLV